MLNLFSQQNKSRLDEKGAAVVDALIDLSKKYTANQINTSSSFMTFDTSRKALFSSVDTLKYDEEMATANECFMRYCVAGTQYAWTGLEMVKDPMVRNDVGFKSRLFAVISQVITPVVPAVISAVNMNWAEIKDISLGDTASFEVDSNELFEVNEAGEGAGFGAAQRLLSQEFTVNPTLKETTIAIDWYWVATNKLDWGKLTYKVGISLGAYINQLVYITLKNSIASQPAAYKANGFSDTNFLNLAQRVQYANNGAKTTVIGTKVALGTVLPSNDYLKVQLGDEWAKVGYLGSYKGYEFMELQQTIVPSTVNTTATFGMDDDYLFFFPVGGYRPIKIVFEGDAYTFQKDSTQTADKTQILQIQRKFAAKAVIGSRFGVLTL